MEEKYRAHPVEIVRNMWRVIFLMLIPFARAVLSLLQGGFAGWSQGAWMDVATVGIIVLLGTLQWYSYTFCIGAQAIELKWGLFYRRRQAISYEKICTLTHIENFFLRPFQAVALSADTPAGFYHKTDFRLYVSRPVADRVMEVMEEKLGKKAAQTEKRYRPKNLQVLLLAAITSNSFAGMVFVATFISGAGKMLGAEFSDRVYGTFEGFARALAFGTPPAAAALAYLMLLGWLCTFAMSVLRHKNFLVTRKGMAIHLSSGIFSKWDYVIDRSKINYLDIRQTLYTKMIGLSSAFIHTFGYSKDKDDIAAIIPAANLHSLYGGLKMLLPGVKLANITVRPRPLRSLYSFLWQPLLPFCVIPLACFLVGRWAPTWKELVDWLGWMGMIPVLWFLLVRLTDCLTSGVGKKDSFYTLRYSRGFSLHTVVIPEEKIAFIRVQESLFQRNSHFCDLYIYSFSEVRRVHRVRNISKVDLFLLMSC